MRYLILSDMHGNWDAMATVLHHVRRKTFDRLVVLGDLVGYGAAPNQVCESVRRMGGQLAIVRGNHDKVVAGLTDGEEFNPVALLSAHWTREKLSASNTKLLVDLPEGPLGVDGFHVCHGSPVDEDQYLMNELQAAESFYGHDFSLCFFGHTHIPCVFFLGPDGLGSRRLEGEKGSIEILPDTRYLVNPGSIGQPRDRDERAAYMIYDSDRGVVHWYRVSYPIARAQRRIRRAGLPDILAERLAYGA